MVDYASQLYGMISGIGDSYASGRAQKQQETNQNRNYAAEMDRFGWQKETDQRDFGYQQTRDATKDNQWERGFGADQAYRGDSLGMDRERLQMERERMNRADQPNIETFYDENGRETKGIYDPSSPSGFRPVGGAKAPMAGRNQVLTAGDRKAVLEADEGVQAGNNVISALDKAMQLNSQAYSGPLAGTRGYIASQFGSEGGVATQQLDNLVTAQALDQLKSTFGSMPTEGERKILLDIQGSVNQSPEVRAAIYERAKAAAQRRIEFNRKQATALRSGEYYSPDYQGPAIDSAPPAARGAQPGMVEDGYVFRGGDPADPNNWEPAQ